MMLSASLFALVLEINGQCVDQGRVLSLVQNEVDPALLEEVLGTEVGPEDSANKTAPIQASEPKDSSQSRDAPLPEQSPGSRPPDGSDEDRSSVQDQNLVLRITCGRSVATFTLTRAGKIFEGRVSLEGLDRDLMERTLALAIAEALPLLEESAPSPQPQPQAPAEAQLPNPPAVEPEKAEPVVDAPPSSEAPEDTAPSPFESLESQALAGGELRVYPSGVVMMGGCLDMKVRRLGLSAALLTTGGTVELYDSAYTNLSLSVSYILLRTGSGRVKGDWGAKVAGGFTSTDSLLRGYIGAGAFAAADIAVTRTWRTRLAGEVGHAGWSKEDQLKHAQGFYFGATLALGVGGNM